MVAVKTRWNCGESDWVLPRSPNAVILRMFLQCIERSKNAVESVRERLGPAAFTEEFPEGRLSRAMSTVKTRWNRGESVPLGKQHQENVRALRGLGTCVAARPQA